MRTWLGLGVIAAISVAGCKGDGDGTSATADDEGSAERAEDRPAPEQPAPLPSTPWKPAAIAHGGVGSPPERTDGCRAAVDRALEVIDGGGAPVDAAVAGVMVLEDDPRFNAGTGSRVRIDGETVQMDAAVMLSDGRFGAVAVIEAVKNPVRVARAVIDSPHIVLAGDGATRFARAIGMEPYEVATEEAKAKTAKIQDKLRNADPSLPERWQQFDWRGTWNFEKTLAAAGLDEEEVGSDTVAVAVRGADGTFAVAISTGGTAITLRGRVGDVPVFGAGIYAGPRGAVAATGTGERIIEAAASRRVYEAFAGGAAIDGALTAMVDEISSRGSIGLIAIGPERMAVAADREMAWAGRELGSTSWRGPAEYDEGSAEGHDGGQP